MSREEFLLERRKKMSSSDCIESVDKRQMFIIKSARRVLSRGKMKKLQLAIAPLVKSIIKSRFQIQKRKKNARRPIFFYNGKFLSSSECEERFDSLRTPAPEIEEDFGL